MAENQVAQNPSNSSSSNTTRRSRSIYSTDRDLESASSLSCRICLDSDTREGDQLIAPCRCKGSQEFVHRECLDHWRSIREGFAFTHCSTCKAAFGLQVKEVKYDIVTRLKHKLFVVKDFFVHFLIAQACLVGICTLWITRE
ncbi:PREDICTED: E3 ubiquitin-protein ligase MARCH1-like [Ipomoea nil]|uniref:E3 ubiquitin-protein ligase MARCH1-like n=1 Tax=Ipomoea nil TaxID=35883 RepID=UPI0009008936|nr:PREDICTED: E3 ubiquitin-protein ligase MARCH1-like [Ipomoea nil]